MPSSHCSFPAGANPTRRAVLRALAVTPFAAAAATRPVDATAVDAASVRVATQNLGLGVSLYPLFFADNERERRVVVGDMFESVRASGVPRRMAVLADKFIEADADVIAVQEAASIAAEGDTIDFLGELSAALDARDSGYRVAVSSVNTDTELPAELDGHETTVRLTDRDALLVAADVSVTDVFDSTFDSTVDVSFSESESFQLTRGFAAVSVTVPGSPAFDVVSTHLERASRAIREEQAKELVSWVAERHDPLVVAGDVNDEPGTGAYSTISEVLVPATEDIEATCCRASNLSGGDLSQAIDHIFSRGFTSVSAHRLTLDSADRVETDRGNLWPSDHAGVVASFEASDTAKMTETASETTPETASSTTEQSEATRTATNESTSNTTTTTVGRSSTADDATTTVNDATTTVDDVTPAPDSTPTETPGFGVVAALAALAAAAARIRRSD